MCGTFTKKLQAELGIGLSYTWVKQRCKAPGWWHAGASAGHIASVARAVLLLHIDGSRHRCFQDERWHDLIAPHQNGRFCPEAASKWEIRSGKGIPRIHARALTRRPEALICFHRTPA
jgi:hypothetical protein